MLYWEKNFGGSRKALKGKKLCLEVLGRWVVGMECLIGTQKKINMNYCYLW